MFERTYDAEYIYQCLTDQKVWRMSSDDNTPEPDLFFVPVQDLFVWIKAGDYGLVMAHRQCADTYEVHVALNLFALGIADKIASSAIEWVFENIHGCNTLIANIPAFNHLAQGLARRVGMRHIGNNLGAFVKNGQRFDTRIYLLHKGNICHRQQQQ